MLYLLPTKHGTTIMSLSRRHFVLCYTAFCYFNVVSFTNYTISKGHRCGPFHVTCWGTLFQGVTSSVLLPVFFCDQHRRIYGSLAVGTPIMRTHSLDYSSNLNSTSSAAYFSCFDFLPQLLPFAAQILGIWMGMPYFVEQLLKTRHSSSVQRTLS